MNKNEGFTRRLPRVMNLPGATGVPVTGIAVAQTFRSPENERVAKDVEVASNTRTGPKPAAFPVPPMNRPSPQRAVPAQTA